MNFSEDLKNAVLQIALQGKLTKQLETDSSVNDLITKITKEKTILAERKKARADKDYGPIQEDEIEFDIPKNWEWIRVSNIGVYKKGPFGSKLTKSLFVPKSKNTVKVFEQKNAIKKDASLGNYYITEEYYNSEMKGFSVEPGDIIVSCAGTIGETYVLPNNIEKGIINQALMRMNIVDSINLDFFLYYFDHILKKSANKASNGSAIKNIPPFDIFKAMLFPLPPIEEQQRIVEKLNTILPIIDSMAVYGTKKKAGRPKQEEALAFISSLLGTNKSTDSKTVTPEILELTSKAKEELPVIVKKYADLMGVTYNRITIRHQKTRWGSCTKTGNLSFNCLIMKMPETVRDYVIVHELAHRKELNHSTKFWTIVAEYCPWYKEAKQWLKDNGQELMGL